MSVTTHEIALETLDGLTGVEALCVFVGEDERPLQGVAGYLDWRLCGRLSRVLQDGFFSGTKEDSLLLPTNGRVAVPRVFALGVGRSEKLTSDELGKVLTFAAKVLTQAKIQSVAMELPGSGVLEDPVRANVLRNVFLPAFKGGKVALLADRGFAKLVDPKA